MRSLGVFIIQQRTKFSVISDFVIIFQYVLFIEKEIFSREEFWKFYKEFLSSVFHK